MMQASPRGLVSLGGAREKQGGGRENAGAGQPTFSILTAHGPMGGARCSGPGQPGRDWPGAGAARAVCRNKGGQYSLKMECSIRRIEKGPSPIQADLGAPFSIRRIENGANNTAVLCVAFSMRVEVATFQHTVLKRVQNNRLAPFFPY